MNKSKHVSLSSVPAGDSPPPLPQWEVSPLVSYFGEVRDDVSLKKIHTQHPQTPSLSDLSDLNIFHVSLCHQGLEDLLQGKTLPTPFVLDPVRANELIGAR